MAFFKEIGKAVSSIAPVAAVSALNPALGSILGLSTVKKAAAGDPPKPPAETDSAFVNQMRKQNQGAQNFYEGLPDYKDEQFRLAAAPGRQQLVQSMRDTNAQMNNRGLLYSGLNQKAQLQNVSNLAQEEADLRQTINQNADQLARDQLYEALQTSLALQDLETGRSNTIYQQQLDRAKQDQAINSGLLSGLGSFAGTYAGSRR